MDAVDDLGQGERNDGELIHQGRLGSIFTAVSQQYHDIADGRHLSVLLPPVSSIHSRKSSGLSESLGRMLFREKPWVGSRFTRHMIIDEEPVKTAH